MDMTVCLQKTRPSQASALVGCLLVLCSLSFSTVGAQDFDPAFLFGPRPGPNSESILVANSGVRVPFGRSIFIDPIKDLVTEVQPGDRCYITVLENDPLAQRPGMLSPKKFPCAFGVEEVKYTHFGSRSPNKDRVRLQLRYDSQTDTIIIPFMLEVEVVSQQLEVLTRNMPLVVDRLNGISNPIDKKVLEFTYDGSSESCKVTTLISTGGLPRYGTLLNYTSNGHMINCDAFVNLGIRYKHTSTTNSPNRDYIPMLVELLDKEGNPVKQEYFQIMVRIKAGTENTPPKPSFVAMMMMEIDQFVMTAITNDMLAAEDVESDQDDLIFNITSQLGYEQGYIISTDDQNLPISSFYQRDINDLKIAYKPPSADSDVERIFQIEFEVVDTEGAISDTFAFMIVVKPMNTLAPVATRNTGQMLFEGQSRALSSTQNLEISDEDNLEDVRITVIDGLKHGELTVLGARRKFFTPADLDAGVVVYQHDGSDTYSDNIIFRFAFMIVVKPMNTLAPVATRNTGQMLFEGQSRALSSTQNLEISDEDNLEDVRITVIDGLKHGELTVLGARRKFFTPADLDVGVVVYQHDGSDTYSDNIIFRMTDGRHEVEFLFPITIAPTDDEPPIINANTGLVLFKNEIMQISPFILSATDIDSEDSSIKFIVEPPYSTTGELLLRQAEQPSDLSAWQFSESEEMFEQVVTEWFQQDILDGKLFYRHIGPHSTTTVMDQFVFRVQDDNDPPNQSGEHIFTIKIHPVDDLPPELFPGTSLHMTVKEYELTHFKKKFLRYTDLDSDDRDLKYTIVMPPTDTDENNPVLLGEIVLTEHPNTVITEFTQAQVNHHKVAYKPPDQELGITPRVVQFTFTVEDTAGNSVDGTFTIFLQPVDNMPPQITNTGFTILERNTFIITRTELDATDPDTDDDAITFTLTQAPKFGLLQYFGLDMSIGETFVLDDIANGRVAYIHGGEESTSDTIKLDVSDGFHELPIIIRITVNPVDDETPTIMLSSGLLGSSIDVLENGVTEITTNVIQGRDEDTDDLMLTFIVDEPPNLGEILVNGLLSERFTQQDMINGAVVYAHTSGEIGLFKVHDSFNLTISDLSDEWVVGGNKVQGVRVHVTILPVDSMAPIVTVGDHFTVLEGEKNVISLGNIKAEDVDTENDDILCTIIVQSTSGYIENISPADGSEKSRAGTAITAFSIKDVRLGHIYYVQSIHKGVEPVEDRLTLRCSDGINFSQRHFFPIVIIPANDEKPEIFIREFVVMEGMSLVIDTPILNAVDADIPGDELDFEIITLPKHGSIVQQLTTGTVPVKNFTLEQIKEGSNIVYEHDDSETKEDSFEIRLTDGKHTVEKKVLIMVIPVDDETPRMTINDGLEVEIGETKVITNKVLKATDLDSEDKTLTYIIRFEPGQVNKGAPTIRLLHTGHLGFMITSKALKSEDRDSHHKFLKYRISEDPLHGYIVNTALGNNSVKTFSQADIDERKICYVLHDGDNATSDIFYFTIEDNAGNKLKSQPFRLNWAWISLEREYFLVDEDSKFLEVTIKRRGYLGETSFVGCMLKSQPFRLNWAWISLEREYFLVDEDSKFLEVTIKRRGYLGETSFVGIGTKDGTAEKDKDFKGKSQKQVQFNPGQSTATWRVKILTDKEYETSETFQIILSDPVMGALEFPSIATVEIVDPGDGTAIGTIPSTVLSYSDYITRPEDHTSILRFDKDEREKSCRVIIIDDSLYEVEETFNVTLSMPMGGQVGGEYPSAKVIILADADDEPSFYFGDTEYVVDESSGYVEVRVWRTGTDLSKTATVTVRSRKTEPVSAEAGVDYLGISRNLDFAPGVTMQTFRVTILDDLGQPVLEGPESFELVLRMPMNAVLGEPSKTTVFINDSISDLPKVQFKEPLYAVNENDIQVNAIVYRSGDIGYKSTVRCYTRQGSAEVMMDYDERPNTDDSIVLFLPGQTEKPCVVILVDDTIYEEEEEFRLVLGTPKSDSPFGASLGEQKETVISIKDEGDKSIIKFSEVKYSIKEPQEAGEKAVVKIPVLRLGDTSKVSIVRVHTKDGSATSGEDYNPMSEDIVFKEGETEHFVEVEVLYDGAREMREAFTVHMKPDENMVAEILTSKAIVYIEEMDSVADVTFPSVPQVVSLLMYDDTAKAKENPNPPTGYPVVCVTACNPKYSEFDKTGSICSAENINDTLTQYRWLVSAPSGSDGVTSPMHEVDTNTFFTNTKSISLDAIYFQAGSRVQCGARAFNANGDAGLEMLSPIFVISREEGLCQPRIPGTVGAEPFSAKIRYTGPEDPDHPNLIRLTVTMPHMDGMLPVISTRPMSNFELTLSPDGTRVGNHKCSNLLDYNEIQTQHGFITDNTKNPEVIGEASPYQYSSALRSSNTLRFYRNLNLEACLWEFNSYYDMSELLTDCSGSIGTDGQVLNLVQSYVTLRVPLYVSYVFHSPVAVGGWQHFDLQSELRLTFVYDTAILWNDGISSPAESELQGALYPTSMRINEEGLLVVNFKTEVRFRGQFVMAHPGTSLSSMVMSADHPGLTFTLSLVRTEPTYNQPVQQWSFISDFAVSDPVAAEFSLNTQMFLLSKRELWLSDGSMGFGEGTDVAFSEAAKIFSICSKSADRLEWRLFFLFCGEGEGEAELEDEEDREFPAWATFLGVLSTHPLCEGDEEER
ncbi:UNVERIFIED_CONTAM: hypothetical protein FKN15_022782 [Acipenser sinensis]